MKVKQYKHLKRLLFLLLLLLDLRSTLGKWCTTSRRHQQRKVQRHYNTDDDVVVEVEKQVYRPLWILDIICHLKF